MAENIWNNALDYLEKSRRIWWNNDYMEFLIEKVWKIKEQVSIIDFGCGTGFLGELLLPLLPKGSTYTGIDIADKLLDHAKERFKDTDFKTSFIECDLSKYEPEEKYDIAICETVLQHIPEPINILKRMKASVKENGMVICMEMSRDVAGASLYIDGIDSGKLNLLGIEQKLRRNSFDRLGKDFEIALKLPVYMEKIGLKNIDIRVNDSMSFISPTNPEYKKELEAFMVGSYGSKISDDSKEQFIKTLMSKGLTSEEAEQEFEGNKKITNYVLENKENVSIVTSNCMFISYGYNIAK